MLAAPPHRWAAARLQCGPTLSDSFAGSADAGAFSEPAGQVVAGATRVLQALLPAGDSTSDGNAADMRRTSAQRGNRTIVRCPEGGNSYALAHQERGRISGFRDPPPARLRCCKQLTAGSRYRLTRSVDGKRSDNPRGVCQGTRERGSKEDSHRMCSIRFYVQSSPHSRCRVHGSGSGSPGNRASENVGLELAEK